MPTYLDTAPVNDENEEMPREYPDGVFEAVQWHPQAWLKREPRVLLSPMHLLGVVKDSFALYNKFTANYNQSGNNGSLPAMNFIGPVAPGRYDLFWVRRCCVLTFAIVSRL